MTTEQASAQAYMADARNDKVLVYVNGAFVPAVRGFQMLVDPPLDDRALYRAPQLVFSNHGSRALGDAARLQRRAIETPEWASCLRTAEEHRDRQMSSFPNWPHRPDSARPLKNR